MASERVDRKLAAIFAADMVGYSRLMEADEEGVIARQRRHRQDLIDPKIAEHDGRIVKLMGDGMLVEFASVVDAVRCAAEIQQAMAEREVGIPDERRIRYRVGINLGDIVIDGDDMLGDGVNVASRLEGLAAPGGICVSDVVYQSVVGKTDLAFDDLGEQQVKNIERPIRVFGVVFDWGKGDATSERGRADTTAVPSEKPSIAVLPFDNLSRDPEQEYFADGIAEDIITALSRFHWFFVIARNSSFSYKGSSPDVRKVGKDLGVQYVLEGSVRKGGNRVRVTAQLIDATTARHIWADRYDRELEDIFLVQDEISESITTAVAPAFVSAETKRAGRKPPDNLDAWDLAMRGNWHLSHHDKEDNAEARRLFRNALKLDPSSTLALSGFAFALCWVNLFGWEDDLEAVKAEAHDAARRAVELDENDAWAHAVLGWVRFSLRQLDGAISECNRALELNPSLALAASVSAIAHSWRSDNEKALQLAKLAEKLSPRDPAQSMWCFARTVAELGYEHHEEAVRWAKLTIETMPDFPGVWRCLAASLAHLGRLDEARAAVRQLLSISPRDSLRQISAAFPAKYPERLEIFVGGLRKAGLPE